ncbi:hypothetical protein CFE70_002869 [Pyrenophora teres f. teres 0-1]
MPAQAFTLVLDGNPTPEATSRVFEIAQRDAEWQTASMEAFPPQNVDHGSAGWGNMVANHSYVMRGSELLSVSSLFKLCKAEISSGFIWSLWVPNMSPSSLKVRS